MIASGGYRELKTEEEIRKALGLVDAWKNPTIPQLQYDLAVKREMDKPFEQVPPFKAFYEALKFLQVHKHCFWDDRERNILEIGASSGYYGELLRRWGIQWDYVGSDYNPEFEKLSNKLYPEQKFIVADALSMPGPDNFWDIVVSGCCMLHMYQWKDALKETVRIAKDYIILHRTPILLQRPTTFFMKEAYGIPCLEIHFGFKEFYDELEKNNLEMLSAIPVFQYVDSQYGEFGHYTILCQKQKNI